MTYSPSARFGLKTIAAALVVVLAGLALSACRPAVRNGRADLYPGNDRVCCVTARADYFTTRRDCRRAGGRPARFRLCRR